MLVKKYEQEEEYAPAQYAFEYSVNDEKTGDVKEQKETRNGDKVEGYYSLIDADGHRRIVHYSSSKETGFVAKVDREEIKGYQAPQQQVKYVQAAPAYKYESAPAYKYEAAPVVQKYVSAPVVQKYVAPVVQKVQYAPIKKVEVAPVKIAYQAPQYSQYNQGSQYNYVSAQAAPKYDSGNFEVKFSSPKNNYNY